MEIGGVMAYIKVPGDIEKRSFEIIEEELGEKNSSIFRTRIADRQKNYSYFCRF